MFGGEGFEWVYDESRNPGLEEHVMRPAGGYYISIVLPVKKK